MKEELQLGNCQAVLQEVKKLKSTSTGIKLKGLAPITDQEYQEGHKLAVNTLSNQKNIGLTYTANYNELKLVILTLGNVGYEKITFCFAEGRDNKLDFILKFSKGDNTLKDVFYKVFGEEVKPLKITSVPSFSNSTSALRKEFDSLNIYAPDSINYVMVNTVDYIKFMEEYKKCQKLKFENFNFHFCLKQDKKSSVFIPFFSVIPVDENGNDVTSFAYYNWGTLEP